MKMEYKFDAGKVADLANQIAEQGKTIERLKVTADHARHEYESATTRLHNLQSEFTKAVGSQIDHYSLDQVNPRPVSHEVRE